MASEYEKKSRLTLLHEVVLRIAGELDRRRLFDGTIEGTTRLLDAPVAVVCCWDPGREELVVESAHGIDLPVGATSPAWMPVGRAFAERRTVVVNDVSSGSTPQVMVTLAAHLHAGVATPLYRDGRYLGILFAAHQDKRRRFGAEDIDLLELLAGHISLAMHNAERMANTTRRLARAEELAMTLHRVAETRTREDAVERTLDCATMVLGADRAAVYLLGEGEEIAYSVGRGVSRYYLTTVAERYRRSAGGLVLLMKTPLFVKDVSTDPRTRVLHEAAHKEGIRTMLLVPVLCGRDILGALALYYDTPWPYDVDEIPPARALCDQLALALVASGSRPIRSSDSSIILASASDRRRDLLATAGVSFKIVPPNINEEPRVDEAPRAYAERMAVEKAREIAKDRKGLWILAADTVVVQGGAILGKPRSESEARTMLQQIAGRTHVVITAVCLIGPDCRDWRRSVVTEVDVRCLSEEEISAYVRSGEWQGKAGAYAIQGIAGAFVTAVRGSYSNVVGLPLAEVIEMMREAGAPPPELGWRARA